MMARASSSDHRRRSDLGATRTCPRSARDPRRPPAPNAHRCVWRLASVRQDRPSTGARGWTAWRRRRRWWCSPGSAAVLSLAGCPAKPAELCDAGSSTCTTGFSTYGCQNFWGVEIASCQASINDAHSWCAGEGGGSNAAYEINCHSVGGNETGDDGTAGAPEWDPGKYITSPSTGAYYVDSDLVDQIKRDFTILENDSALLVDSGLSEYFQLSGVASGDLADVLGLQTGDILLSVNRQSLDGIGDAIDAYKAVEDDTTVAIAATTASALRSRRGSARARAPLSGPRRRQSFAHRRVTEPYTNPPACPVRSGLGSPTRWWYTQGECDIDARGRFRWPAC